MRVHVQGDQSIAVLAENLKITCVQDMLDVMATLRYEHDITGMIVPAACLGEKFFSLKSGYAGEMLQKFSNYQMKIAIVGDFGNYTSRPLQDFMRECNRGRLVFFKESEEEALKALCEI